MVYRGVTIVKDINMKFLVVASPPYIYHNQRVPRMFFKAVVQVVLIFGADTLVMTLCMGQYLGGGYNTGYFNGSLGDIPRGYWTGDGSIYLWRRL